MTQVDFDGTGQKFHSLALFRRSGGEMAQEFVVFRRKKDGFEIHVLIPAMTVGRLSVIWRFGPGTAQEWDSGKKTSIPHDSLVVETMEAGSQQYYLSGGKFRFVQTSD